VASPVLGNGGRGAAGWRGGCLTCQGEPDRPRAARRARRDCEVAGW
jgi:hypothetical protein